MVAARQKELGCCASSLTCIHVDLQVAEEVRQQMFRLAGHASVLVLGGNNEVENAFEWFEPSRSISNL